MDKCKWKYPVLDAIKLGCISSPVYVLIVAIQMIVSSVVPTVQILAMAWFIDSVMEVVTENGNMSRTVLPALCVGGIVVYEWTIRTIMSLVWVKLENCFREAFTTQLVKRKAQLKYSDLENPRICDLTNRVISKAEKQMVSLIRTMSNSICLICKIIGVLSVIFLYQWWTALIMVVICIPLIRLAILSGKATYEVEQEVTKYSRQCEYLSELITGREAAQERALFGFTNWINSKWSDMYTKYGKKTAEASFKWFARLEGGSIITAVVSAINIALLIRPVITGVLSVGLFVSLVNACLNLIDAMSWELRGYIDSFTNRIAYFGDVRRFMQLEIVKENLDERNPFKKFEKIEFENVSFTYPGTDQPVLENVSFVIENGRHYALVGKNGTGKTTIVKLLTGLYSNYSGRILVNGIDIRSISIGKLKGLFSVIYQDFAKYAISIKDNLLLANSSLDETAIEEVLKMFGLAEIAENGPNGVDTVLGKIDENGIDLSGGEWQRLAIARTYVNQAPVYLLDEPTAALDPMAECAVYQDFQMISKGKTTLLISHRLGSVKLVDEIFVLDGGRIIERGSHEQLMEMEGLYQEMYNSQAGGYA